MKVTFRKFNSNLCSLNFLENFLNGSYILVSVFLFLFYMIYLLTDLFSLLKDYAAAAAKLLHLCPTLCNPRDGSPPGSPVPGILQVAISFSNA